MGRHGFEPWAAAAIYQQRTVVQATFLYIWEVLMVETDHSDKSVSEAVGLYVEDRDDELAEQTKQSHKYRLNHLIRYCTINEIQSVSELQPMVLTDYKQWRKRDGDLNITSMHTQLTTLSVFIQWCESKNLLPNGVHEAIQIPSLNGEDQRERRLDGEVAQRILSYLDKYEYAQRAHVIFRLMWRTAMRLGAIHSLDVDDYDSDSQQLHVKHRPTEGTPIKKQSNGERIIALNDKTCIVLDDYIETNRHAHTDEYGRSPLITSKQGRLTTSSIRREIYRLTQPCLYTNECPHNRVLDECEAKGYTNTRGCPSSMAPHDIRRGSITEFLSDDIPKEIVADRCDVSLDVIDDHYDQRSMEDKSEQRRKYFQ